MAVLGCFGVGVPVGVSPVSPEAFWRVLEASAIEKKDKLQKKHRIRTAQGAAAQSAGLLCNRQDGGGGSRAEIASIISISAWLRYPCTGFSVVQPGTVLQTLRLQKHSFIQDEGWLQKKSTF